MTRTRLDPVLVAAAVVTALALAAPVHSIALLPLTVFIAPIASDWVVNHLALRSLTFHAAASPTVVSAGESSIVAFTLTAPSPRVARRIQFELTVDGTTAILGGQGCSLRLEQRSIGIVDHLDVTIGARWLGIASSSRVRRVALANTLHCGPKLGEHEIPAFSTSIDGLTARPYSPGDRPGRINWLATARTGTLLVRSAERSDEELVVVVDSSDADESDLAWLSLPADTALEWWQHDGGDVRLVTREVAPDGVSSTVVDEWVHNRTDLLRRLARVRRGPNSGHHYPEALRFGPSGQTR